MNVILFTDLSDSPMFIRVQGAYSIASHLRNNGYTVKVIDNQAWLWENHGKKLTEYVEGLIDSDTIFVGFSSTFSRYFDTGFQGIGAEDKSSDVISYLDQMINRIHLMHPHVKVILGGQGAQTYKFYQYFEDKIDCWIRGMGEDSILQFVRNEEAGIENPPVMEDRESPIFDFHNQNNIFHVEDDILDHEVFPLAISRGCRFKCKFCTFSLLGRLPSEKYIRSEDSIYNELKYNYDNFSTTSYMLTDDTFNETTEKIESVIRAVDRVGVQMNFWAYIRIELLHKYPEQIKLLSQLGLRSCFFGLESLHDLSAKSIGKGLGRDKTLETLESVKNELGEDSVLHGSFIIGLPHETLETANEWTDLVIKDKTPLDTASFNRLGLTPDYIMKSGDTSRIFFSEFELNKKKYGYIDTGDGGWKNQHWTDKTAHVYATKIKDRFMKERPAFTHHMVAQNSMSMMNLKVVNPELSWSQMHGMDKQTLESNVISSREKMLNLYMERLFNE